MQILIERVAYWVALGAFSLAACYYLLGNEFTLFTADGAERAWSFLFDVHAQGDDVPKVLPGSEKVQLAILAMLVASVFLFGLSSRRH